MVLFRNIKRLFTILGLIASFYLLTFLKTSLDLTTWHYNLTSNLIFVTELYLIAWFSVVLFIFSNDFFDWNLERVTVCVGEGVKWIEGFSIIEDSNLPALIKVALLNESGYVYDVVDTINESGNYYSKNGKREFREDEIIAYIPLSHLTNEDEE